MSEIIDKRGTKKRPITTHKEVSKEHIQNSSIMASRKLKKTFSAQPMT